MPNSEKRPKPRGSAHIRRRPDAVHEKPNQSTQQQTTKQGSKSTIPSSASSTTIASSSSSSTASIASSTSTVTAPHRSQFFLILVLTPLNNTFERKTLVLPFYPEVLKLGRQTSPKNAPAPDNGFFDSRVLSRSHAEVWADRVTGKVWIKDSKSSNGTYINFLRLGNEKSESEPHELKKNDILELGIDITNDDRTSFVHRKISARVERISMMSVQAQDTYNSTSLNNNNSSNPYRSLSLGLENGNNNNNNNGNNSNQNSGYSLDYYLQNSNLPSKSSYVSAAESLDVTLFGEIDASLEDLSLSHTRNSVGGLFMSSGISSSSILEQIVKRLVTEIHHAKVESAKIRSVAKLLEEIAVNQQESRLLSERLPALDVLKEKIKVLSANLEQARRDLALKDSIIDEKDAEIKSLTEALERKTKDSEQSSESENASTSLNDEADSRDINSDDRDVSDKDSDMSHSYIEPFPEIKHFSNDQVDDSIKQKPESIKIPRPLSPEPFDDPSHQLSTSPPLEISKLNLNIGGPPSINNNIRSVSPNGLAILSKTPQLGAAAIILGNNSLLNDPISRVPATNNEDNNDFDDDEDEDGILPRRAASVPSYSPPHSPIGSYSTEIRSLPQSPRGLFNGISPVALSSATHSPKLANSSALALSRATSVGEVLTSRQLSERHQQREQTQHVELGRKVYRDRERLALMQKYETSSINGNSKFLQNGISMSLGNAYNKNNYNSLNKTQRQKFLNGSVTPKSNLLNSNDSIKSTINDDKTNDDNAVDNSSIKNSNTNTDDEALQLVLEEVEKLKCQIEMYKSRAENAERMALEKSKLIGELSTQKIRSDSMSSTSREDLAPLLSNNNNNSVEIKAQNSNTSSSSNDTISNEKSNKESAIEDDDNDIKTRKLDKSATLTNENKSKSTNEKSLSSSAVSAPTKGPKVTSYAAIGIVVVGISLMSILNSFTRGKQ